MEMKIGPRWVFQRDLRHLGRFLLLFGAADLGRGGKKPIKTACSRTYPCPKRPAPRPKRPAPPVPDGPRLDRGIAALLMP